MSTSTILHETAEVRAHAIGNIVVMAWHAAPTKRLVEAVQEKVAPHHQQHPQGVGLVVLPLGAPPEQDGRAALDNMMKSIGRHVTIGAVVLSMGGVRGKLIRAAAATIVKTMRLPFDIKVVDSKRAAAEHVVGALSKSAQAATPAVSELESVITTVESPLR